MECENNRSQSIVELRRNREQEFRERPTLPYILLRSEDRAALEPPVATADRFCRGSETILLVDDEPLVLTITRRFLESFGYRVLSAQSGAEAECAVEAFRGSIDLLLTDIVMAAMNGKELSLRLAAKIPDLKILFMSGYPGDVLRGECMLEEGAGFLLKPFTRIDLSKRVREVLDSERRQEA